MTASLERSIFEGLKTVIENDAQTNAWVKHVEFEKIKLATQEWGTGKLPVVQFWFEEQVFTMQRNLAQFDLRMTVEIIMKNTQDDQVTQGVLLDRMRDIREVVGRTPRLGITGRGMLHLALVRATRDFATQEPFFVGQIQFSAIGEVPYNGC